MPLYEYKCSRCDHRFEVLQRLGDEGANLECPECGHREVKKQFSTFASGGESTRSSAGSAPAGGCRAGSGFT